MISGLSSEVPLDAGCMFIAVALPCSQLLAEQSYIFNPPGQALACHYIKLYFSNIQPASMLGSVMDFKLFCNSAGFRCWKCFV